MLSVAVFDRWCDQSLDGSGTSSGSPGRKSFAEFMSRRNGRTSLCIPCLPKTVDLKVRGGDFSGCDLSGCTIVGDISGATFDRSNMTGARYGVHLWTGDLLRNVVSFPLTL